MLTTLQLAHAVAHAARTSAPDDAARAVLDCLHRHEAWFCRFTTTDGADIEARMAAAPPKRTPLPAEEDRPLPFEEPDYG
jgi:hypothetical protein